MALTINLDADYADVLLDGQGELEIADGDREIILTVVELLRTSQGEWEQDVTLGLPFAEQLRTGIIDNALAPGIVESAILSVQGVSSARIERVTNRNRHMAIDAVVVTAGGTEVRLDEFVLHPSDSGAMPPQPENVLGWMNVPVTWQGNYMRGPYG